MVTNVELDHHSEFASLAELEAGVRPLGGARRRTPSATRRRSRARSPCPASTTAATRARALAALELAGVDRAPRPAALGRFTGTGRRFEVSEAGGVTIVDDYAPPSCRDRRRRSPPRGRPSRAAGCARSSSRTSSRAPDTSRPTSAPRSPRPTTWSSPTSTRRASSRPGRRRQARRRRALRPRRVSRRGSRPSPRPRPTWLRGPAPATCCSCSARATSTPRRRSFAGSWRWRGDRPRGGRAALAASRRSARAGRRGCFARPATVEELEELVALGRRRGRGGRDDRARLERARGRRRASTRSCSGSRASSRPRGSRATTLVAGGGAKNAVCLHRARDAGLGGLEFASAIPGTAGGGVRMNAGAYGRDWSCRARSTLRRRWPPGARTRRPASELGLELPALGARARRGRGAGPVPARRRDPSMRSGPRSAELLAQRKATQPTTKRTFGSVFKNPRRGPRGRRPDRGMRPQGSPDRRRADLGAARELHRERGRRHERRRARTDGRGPSPRARAGTASRSSTRCDSWGPLELPPL